MRPGAGTALAPWRGARGGVLAVVAVGLAVAAHAGTDGCASLAAVALALGLAWPAAVAVLGRRRRVPALLAWLMVVQVGLHVLLESRCQEVVSGRQGLLHHLSSPPSARMLLAHGFAVVVSAVLLGRADGAAWAVDVLRRAVLVVLPLQPALVPRVATHQAGGVVPPVRQMWKGPRPSRRGPPALLAP